MYEQVQETVALQERQRLARELHDEVSQTLFSANLIAASIAHTKYDDIPIKLVELRRLTQGALAEMRSLLIELRPTTLIEASLQQLLIMLANAFSAKTDASINVNVEDISFKNNTVKTTIYRIVQESLNNIVKHAMARTVEIVCLATQTHVKLSITDDGIGFDMKREVRGRMGLSIMSERASIINGQLSIKSKKGEGTQVILTIPFHSSGAII